MKSKPLLYLLAGVAIGAIAGVYFAPQNTIKKRRGPVKKITQSKKIIKSAAGKYEEELRRMG